jgi:small subunit ribosomal protein S18
MNKEINKPEEKQDDKDPNIDYFDYKDVELLKKSTSYYGKIEPGTRTGMNRKNQARLARAIKRARYMALLPYFTQ